MNKKYYLCCVLTWQVTWRGANSGVTLMERIDAVVNCTLIRVKNKAKFTNLMKLIRIEGYNGK